MTPLVDVVLVLLIIFMLVTPLIDDRVRLPATAHPAVRPDAKEKLLITLEGDRTLRIDGKLVTPHEVVGRLVEAHAKSPAAVVAVKADARLPYGAVKSTLVSLHDAGFDRIGLITKPPSGTTSGDSAHGHRPDQDPR